MNALCERFWTECRHQHEQVSQLSAQQACCACSPSCSARATFRRRARSKVCAAGAGAQAGKRQSHLILERERAWRGRRTRWAGRLSVLAGSSGRTAAGGQATHSRDVASATDTRKPMGKVVGAAGAIARKPPVHCFFCNAYRRLHS